MIKWWGGGLSLLKGGSEKKGVACMHAAKWGRS